MSQPVVSVIMSVYNGAPFLSEALDSLLRQTFTSFEVVIVDDASMDATPDILERYRSKDCRIRVLRNEINKERSFSRNRAIRAAKGEYVAVLDADDICLPYRLEKQVAFMRKFPHVTVCGSALETFGEKHQVWFPPVEHASNISRLFFSTCVYHSTVMMRVDMADREKGIYDESISMAEDYTLWLQIALAGGIFANIPEILVKYRLTPKDYTASQRKAGRLARLNFLNAAGVVPSEAEWFLHEVLTGLRDKVSVSDLWACKQWMTKLYAGVANSGICEADEFRKELMWRWQHLVRRSRRNPIAVGIYLASEFGDWHVALNKFPKTHKT